MTPDLLRLLIFLGVLVGMSLWERAAPRRAWTEPRSRRWPANLGLSVAGSVLLRLTVGAAAYRMAVVASDRSWGLLHLFDLPPPLPFLVSFLLLDFGIYVQHLVFHYIPLFWRLHQVHHTDLDFDATTGVRFHPAEILLSMLYKAALVSALGASPAAVLAFEIALNAASLFNHGNVRIAREADQLLRFLVVTPDMHRVHHSVVPEEMNSNFGFSVSFWDRLLGTYRERPWADQEKMEIGQKDFRDGGELGLFELLTFPFRQKAAGGAGAARPS